MLRGPWTTDAPIRSNRLGRSTSVRLLRGYLHAQGITFITLRRRTDTLKLHVRNAPAGTWRRVELDIPHRKLRTPKVLDEHIQLGKDYPEPVRQICARDLGHDEPTILLTNDTHSSPPHDPRAAFWSTTTNWRLIGFAGLTTPSCSWPLTATISSAAPAI
jgi:hypothetical protein